MAVKINKNHGGKEFKSSFHFVGKVKPFRRFENGIQVPQPYYDETPTRTGKPQRRITFVLETAKDNDLKIEGRAYEQDFVYPYSRSEKNSTRVKWEDRFDKSKLPNDSYHFIDTDWDKFEGYAELLEDGVWIDVRGHYEFDKFKNSEGQEIKLVKRIVDNLFIVNDGDEVKRDRKVIVENYVTDFESDGFQEVNHNSIQVGINTVFQEEGEKDVKINGYFLDYGKERSMPKDLELKVPYVEPPAGKISLADAFLQLNKFDFVEVVGQDFNTVTYADVEVESEESNSDPFAMVDESDKSFETKRVVSGTRKGLEVMSIVDGSYVAEMLTEEEITPPTMTTSKGNDSTKDVEDNPFANTDVKVEEPVEDPFDENDPFA